jgi:putative SOS response-associated peptidase YedK
LCGRAVTKDQAAIERYFNVTSDQYTFADRFNVAPSTQIPVVGQIDGKRVMTALHWGLIPHWAKDKKIGYQTGESIYFTRHDD